MPKVGDWVGLTLDGTTEAKGQVSRVVSETVVDVNVVNDLGHIVQGAVELTLAQGLNRSSPGLWWPKL